MMNQAAAAEYKTNVGRDFTMADAFDAEYMDTNEGARRYFHNSGELETPAEHARWCEGCADCW